MTLYLLALVSLVCDNQVCVTEILHLESPASMSIYELFVVKRKASET